MCFSKKDIPYIRLQISSSECQHGYDAMHICIVNSCDAEMINTWSIFFWNLKW